MRPTHALVIILLSVAGCAESRVTTPVEFVDRKSIESCDVLSKTDEQPLRERASTFFLSEVQADVSNVRIARGAKCDSEILFAISVDDANFRRPFFVRVDSKSRKMELLRPH